MDFGKSRLCSIFGVLGGDIEGDLILLLGAFLSTGDTDLESELSPSEGEDLDLLDLLIIANGSLRISFG